MQSDRRKTNVHYVRLSHEGKNEIDFVSHIGGLRNAVL